MLNIKKIQACLNIISNYLPFPPISVLFLLNPENTKSTLTLIRIDKVIHIRVLYNKIPTFANLSTLVYA